MNPTGNEFQLRVAICDLVERLKRMQHKCSYLEECRNQLVKEVIRLRLQNEWLAKQINDSPGVSTSLPPSAPPAAAAAAAATSNAQCFCNQPSLVNSPYHSPNCHLNGQDIDCSEVVTKPSQLSPIKDDNLQLFNILNEFDQNDLNMKQDSIKQLTIQMLKELDTEMKTGKLKSDLINFVKNSSTAENVTGGSGNELMKFDVDDSKDANQMNVSSNYEAFNNNSDYYSNSHNLNIPLEDLQYAQNAFTKVKSNDSPLMALESDRQLPANNKSTHLELDDGTAARGSVNTSPAVEAKLNKSLLDSIDLISKEDELLSIIVSVRNDLKTMHQTMLASTDRLNRIKNQQLRNYFQKQINLDNVATGTTAVANGKQSRQQPPS